MSASFPLIRYVFILAMQVAWVAGLLDRTEAHDIWRSPSFALPARGALNGQDVPEVERLYARALELQDQSDESCVDCFFEVARLTANAECCENPDRRAHRLHQSSLQKLVIAGQQFRRLDPRCGLTVIQGGIKTLIPIRHHGFVWTADEFDYLTVVGDYHTKKLSHFYVRPGVGVPLVVSSCRRDESSFRAPESAFPATLRMVVGRAPCHLHTTSVSQDAVCLELYDPLRVETVSVGSSRCPIAKDLSAPIVYRFETRRSGILDGFLRPNTVSPGLGNAEGRLYTLEPYQPGKTPIVLIHGLLSDRFAWAEMINELLARPDFVDRYQIWLFDYPTGRTFLGSAAQLRRQLESLCQTIDPFGADPQLSNLILAAHSMGGLIAKMQITDSGDQLWRSVANQPLDRIVTPPGYRELLEEIFFFSPSPRISRVVYFATPHRGSEFATRLIGRIATVLVEEPEEEVRSYRALIRDNPNVFSREVSRRIPTSVDLLEPESKLLQASDKLPVRCGVAIHSIIGSYCWTLSLGRSDGVVSVSSARDRKAITERIVHATHSRVKEHPDSIEEFLAILQLHLRHENDKDGSCLTNSVNHDHIQRPVVLADQTSRTERSDFTKNSVMITEKIPPTPF